MQVLNDQGYLSLTDLRESVIDVGFDEVLRLLGCLFTSETPLTSAFLEKNFMTKMNQMLSLLAGKARGVEPSRSLCYVRLFVRKSDREILYAECNEDFIGSLVSFLVLPLELVYSLCNDNTILRCVGSLCRSPCRRATASNFYQIPDISIGSENKQFIHSTHSSPVLRFYIPKYASCPTSCKLYREIDWSLPSSHDGKTAIVRSNDPKVKRGTSSNFGNGFMKRNTKFLVSNDLIISPMNSSSIIDLSKKMQLGISDLEEHQIGISRAELINILRASLFSSSALTNGLSNFLIKKVKEET